jgi:hypothetical protein
VIAAAFLAALVTWDAGRRGASGPPAAPLGLWMPVNVRRHREPSFGNGTSRVRLHAWFDAGTPFEEICRIVRRQLSASLRDGEWSLPGAAWVRRLPVPLTRGLLRMFARRPGVDMGSAVFTHMAGSALAAGRPGNDQALPRIDRIDCVGLLDRRHPIGLACLTHLGTTFATFTYDPALLTGRDVLRIAGQVQERLARNDLTRSAAA